VLALTDGDFTKTTLYGTWVVEFGATWCGPCKAMKPVMDNLASELGAKVQFGTVDVDKNKAFLKRYKVKALPTFVLMKNGSVVATKVGGMSKQKLTAFATQ
jgi:thioredoxin 1